MKNYYKTYKILIFFILMGRVMGATAVYNGPQTTVGGYDNYYNDSDDNHATSSPYPQPRSSKEPQKSGNIVIDTIKDHKKKSAVSFLMILAYIGKKIKEAQESKTTITIGDRKLSPEETQIHLKKEAEKKAQAQKDKIKQRLQSKLQKKAVDSSAPAPDYTAADTTDTSGPLPTPQQKPTPEPIPDPTQPVPAPIPDPTQPAPAHNPTQQPAAPNQVPMPNPPQAPVSAPKPTTYIAIYQQELAKTFHDFINKDLKQLFDNNDLSQWTNFDDDLRDYINDYLSKNADPKKALTTLSPLDKFSIKSNEISIEFCDQKIGKPTKLSYTNNTLNIENNKDYDMEDKVNDLKKQVNEIFKGIQSFVKNLNDLNADFKKIFTSSLLKEATYMNKIAQLLKINNKKNLFLFHPFEEVFRFNDNELYIMEKFNYKPSTKLFYGSKFSYNIDYDFIKKISNRIKTDSEKYNVDNNTNTIINSINIFNNIETNYEGMLLKPIQDGIVKGESMEMFKNSLSKLKMIEQIQKKLITKYPDCSLEHKDDLGVLTISQNGKPLIIFNLSYYMNNSNVQIKNKQLESELLLYYDENHDDLEDILEYIKTIILDIHKKNKAMYIQDQKDIEQMHQDIKNLIDSIPDIDDYSVIYPNESHKQFYFKKDKFIIRPEIYTVTEIPYEKNIATIPNTIFQLKPLYDPDYDKKKIYNKKHFATIKENIETGINEINRRKDQINNAIESMRQNFINNKEIYDILQDPSINLKPVVNSKTMKINITSDNIEIFAISYPNTKVILYKDPSKNEIIHESFQLLFNKKELLDNMKTSFEAIKKLAKESIEKYRHKELKSKFPNSFYTFFDDNTIGTRLQNLRIFAAIRQNFVENNTLNTDIVIGTDFVINIEKLPSTLDIKYFQLKITNQTVKMFDIIVYENSLYYDFNDMEKEVDFDINMKPKLLQFIKEFFEDIKANYVTKK